MNTRTGNRRSELVSSVLSRERILRQLEDAEGEIPHNVRHAVQSTTTFAAWEWPEEAVFKIARGTLRKLADRCINSPLVDTSNAGWKRLDALRRTIKEKAEGSLMRSNENASLMSASRKTEQLVARITVLEGEMLIQTKAYLHLLQQLRGIANGSSIHAATRQKVLGILNHHDEVYSSIFGPELVRVLRPDNVERMER